MWDETFRIKIQNPPMAVFRLAIFDEDMFGEPNFIGAATYPSTSILKGFRSVPLKNGHSEELELSTLLVKVSVFTIYWIYLYYDYCVFTVSTIVYVSTSDYQSHHL